MALMRWTEDYTTGIEEIDAQHKKLFGIFNDFHEALRQRKAKGRLRELILELEAYSKYHFYGEEALMARLHYAGALLHRFQHEAYIRRVNDFDERYVKTGSDPRLMVEVLVYLAEWIKKHVLVEDLKYAAHLKSKKANVLDELAAGEGRPQVREKLAARTMENPALLKDLFRGLASDFPAECLDCADVILKVARRKPLAVARQADQIAEFISHPNPELSSWSLEVLLVIADKALRTIGAFLPDLKKKLRVAALDHDRDNILRLLGRYARTSRKAAESVLPLVQEALTARGDANLLAGLEALAQVASGGPHLAAVVRNLAVGHVKDDRELVRKAARGLLRAAERPAAG